MCGRERGGWGGEWGCVVGGEVALRPRPPAGPPSQLVFTGYTLSSPLSLPPSFPPFPLSASNPQFTPCSPRSRHSALRAENWADILLRRSPATPPPSPRSVPRLSHPSIRPPVPGARRAVLRVGPCAHPLPVHATAVLSTAASPSFPPFQSDLAPTPQPSPAAATLVTRPTSRASASPAAAATAIHRPGAR